MATSKGTTISTTNGNYQDGINDDDDDDDVASNDDDGRDKGSGNKVNDGN